MKFRVKNFLNLANNFSKSPYNEWHFKYITWSVKIDFNRLIKTVEVNVFCNFKLQLKIKKLIMNL